MVNTTIVKRSKSEGEVVKSKEVRRADTEESMDAMTGVKRKGVRRVDTGITLVGAESESEGGDDDKISPDMLRKVKSWKGDGEGSKMAKAEPCGLDPDFLTLLALLLCKMVS
jgi:hypothetical protein